MKLKKYKKKKLSNFLEINLLIIILSFGLSLFIIGELSKKSEEILLPMAKAKLEKAISQVINYAISDVDGQEFYTLDKFDGEIKMINYNAVEVTKILNKITWSIEDNLYDIENNESKLKSFSDGGIYGEIPLGVIFDNVFLNNLGPKIKLKFLFSGSIISRLETEVKPYGINNAYLEMRVRVSVTGRIILPFVSEEVTIENLYPVSINVVSGSVPNGYISSYK